MTVHFKSFFQIINTTMAINLNTTIANFGKTLDDEQANLSRDDIVISDADKKHHFLMQIKKAKKFSKQEWRVYDKKTVAEKTWDLTKKYFKELEIDDENKACPY